MNNLTQHKGFTLIEMLVVVAVIGVLSSVLLTALGPARDKAKDSRIVQEINQVRSLAETLYDGDYDALEEISASTDSASLENEDLRILTADIAGQGGQLIIVKSGKPTANFIVYSKLNTKVGLAENQQINYYCVDNRGRNAMTVTPEENIQYGKIECPSQ